MQLIECPRDAMQGIHAFIPTEIKINYLNKLLRVGFHTLDVGSFVSPKAIPQMADTAQVLAGLNLTDTRTRLLAIIANMRGAREAAAHKTIDYLGYPLSISETFQQRNTNKSISQALEDVAAIQALCKEQDKQLVVYISMAFGNPYNDPYSLDYLEQFAGVLASLEVDVVSLSDTVGVATPAQLSEVFTKLSTTYPAMPMGVHLHSNPATAAAKITAALQAGCTRFDGAVLGYGGCPMAKDELTGNIDTATIIAALSATNPRSLQLNMDAYQEAAQYAQSEVFGKYQ